MMPKMMDRHCVIKMPVIVLLQPMDCQRAVFMHGGAEPGGSGVKSRPAVSSTASHIQTPQKTTAAQTRKTDVLEEEDGKKIVPPTFFFFFFFSDTQSSLKLTTVYAVSEDSHRGGPVLLERLTDMRKYTLTLTHTQVKRGDE